MYRTTPADFKGPFTAETAPRALRGRRNDVNERYALDLLPFDGDNGFDSSSCLGSFILWRRGAVVSGVRHEPS